MNSFFPDATKIWNSIGTDFEQANSFKNFKKQINSLIRPDSKSTFGIHDTIGLKFLFQLRIGLSPLKYHKYKHNFQDTPNGECTCSHRSEDTSHFFFFCHLYSTPRIVLIDSTSHILNNNNLSHLSENTDLFLYGHRSLSFDDNKTILKSTINFLKESNRFTQYIEIATSYVNFYLCSFFYAPEYNLICVISAGLL